MMLWFTAQNMPNASASTLRRCDGPSPLDLIIIRPLEDRVCLFVTPALVKHRYSTTKQRAVRVPGTQLNACVQHTPPPHLFRLLDDQAAAAAAAG